MKKILALLLAVVMCLSFAACGSGNGANAEKAILGPWNEKDGYDVCVFSDDGKITRGDEQYDWWYDKESERFSMSVYGLTYTFVIEEDESGRYFTVDGIRYYYIENYDPETLKAEYIEKKTALLTEGRIELNVGNTYTTESGVKFKLEKAEITGDDECLFNLYITSEDVLSIENEKYNYFGGTSSFGLGSQPESSDKNTRCYAGGVHNLSELQSHQETYGFLCFTIDETDYYVSINTFFA